VEGEFWSGEIARHHRLRLAYAVWTLLSRRLLADEPPSGERGAGVPGVNIVPAGKTGAT
jgi:hypothetical protein